MSTYPQPTLLNRFVLRCGYDHDTGSENKLHSRRATERQSSRGFVSVPLPLCSSACKVFCRSCHEQERSREAREEKRKGRAEAAPGPLRVLSASFASCAGP